MADPLVFNGLPLSGTTAQRPTNASMGQPYYDNQLKKLLVYDSTDGAWYDAAGDSPLDEGNGAKNGSTVAVVESGGPAIHRTTLTLTAHTIALTDEAGVVAYGGSKIYDFPAGAILILGATSDLDVTKSSAGVNADWDGDFSLGTVTASNNTTLSGTEQDILPTTPTPQASSGATTANGQSTSTQIAVLDGTSTAKDLYLNVLVDDADHNVNGTACNLIFNGTITVTWLNLGDY